MLLQYLSSAPRTRQSSPLNCNMSYSLEYVSSNQKGFIHRSLGILENDHRRAQSSRNRGEDAAALANCHRFIHCELCLAVPSSTSGVRARPRFAHILSCWLPRTFLTNSNSDGLPQSACRPFTSSSRKLPIQNKYFYAVGSRYYAIYVSTIASK